jgi:hypothetical protein
LVDRLGNAGVTNTHIRTSGSDKVSILRVANNSNNNELLLDALNPIEAAGSAVHPKLRLLKEFLESEA